MNVNEKQRTSSLWRVRKREFVLTLIALILMLVLFSRFAVFVEGRPGVVLDDPLLRLLPSFDLTWPIFVVIYGGILLGVVTLARLPDALLLAMRSYVLLLVVRIAAMYVAPFAPPEKMILLIDPVAGIGPGNALRNDLFFSGHTATLFLLSLTSVPSHLRRLFLVLTILLGAMLLLQHVHYTVDVLSALFFTWGCYSLSKKLPTSPTNNSLRHQTEVRS